MIENSNITDYLNYYLENENASNYAVLIDGGWGSGKTFFIKKYIVEREQAIKKLSENEKEEYLYLSVYGLTSTVAIDDLIFQKLHPFLASKGMEVAGKVAKGLLKFGLKIDLDTDTNISATNTSTIPDVKFQDYLKKFDQGVLIFDDIERCQIPISEFLGYINYYVEHLGKKVILIANESEIKEKQSENNSKILEYNKIREKVVGKHFAVQSNPVNIIPLLIEANSKDLRNSFLKENQNELINVFNIVAQLPEPKFNYRAFAHVIREFDFILDQIEADFSIQESKNKEALLIFLKAYFPLAYEVQIGLIDSDLIKKMSTHWDDSLLREIQKDKTKIKEDALYESVKCFFSRYSNWSSRGVILNFAGWEKLLCSHSLDFKYLVKALKSLDIFWNENTPEWEKLWHFRNFEDGEFEKVLKKTSQALEDIKYGEKDVPILMHIWGTLLYLCSKGFELPVNIGNELTLIEVNAKQYIDQLFIDKKLPIHSKILYDREQYSQYGYMGKNFTEFDSIKTYFIKRIDEFSEVLIQEKAQDIYSLMIDNKEEFYRLFATANNNYDKVAIFKHLKPQEFLDAFLKVPNRNKEWVNLALEDRFKDVNNVSPVETYKAYLDDEAFFVELKELIEMHIEKNQKKSISLMLLNGFLENVVYDILNKMNMLKSNLNSV